MAVTIPRALVENILLGPMDDRRQLQDTPFLGDVWIAYAKNPDKAIELLITPVRDEPAGIVACMIDDQIVRSPPDGPELAALQGVVAARLYFDELLRVVLPMTRWWHGERVQADMRAFREQELAREQAVAAGTDEIESRKLTPRLERVVSKIVEAGENWKDDAEAGAATDQLPAVDKLIALAGLIMWARDQSPKDSQAGRSSGKALADVLDEKSADAIRKLLVAAFKTMAGDAKTVVWQVSLNRVAKPAIERSVPAVKADAAKNLFSVNCSKVVWAVIDSGIKADHPAFKDKDGNSRVRRSFDFTRIREIVRLDNLRIFKGGDQKAKANRLAHLLPDDLKEKPSPKEAEEWLTALAQDARHRRAIHWEYVRPFIEISTKAPPNSSNHGTHVAGIIGACKASAPAGQETEDHNGMCPDIQLWDFRVLAGDIRSTEFSVIAALQFIRYLNGRTDHMAVHGANMSLSIPHDVRNYACGRTPICLESERLVDSGVLVVAAAGNLGFQNFQTERGSYEGYTAFSITDPGNAEGVITVGATHRYSPHTYGVSFFSSRGPTGDGRPKPDLVAPGERIRGPFREGWGDLDGTSMAAPHVSGAAAMLMARYSEFVGQPRRIKKILCDTATDLGRERSFQGNGMLDVLRAFQNI